MEGLHAARIPLRANAGGRSSLEQNLHRSACTQLDGMGVILPPHIGISWLTSAIASASQCPQVSSSLRQARAQCESDITTHTTNTHVSLTYRSPFRLLNASSGRCYSQLTSSEKRHEARRGYRPDAAQSATCSECRRTRATGQNASTPSRAFASGDPRGESHGELLNRHAASAGMRACIR